MVLTVRVFDGGRSFVEATVSRDRFSVALDALVFARESRDGFPSEYAPELVALVRALCVELGMDDWATSEAVQVALHHDIGKLGISADVLTLNRRLSEGERAEMSQYPVISERLLRDIPGMERIAHAVRHVQEHWDGSGYPDGLVGDAIPLASRIVFVASSYVAMSTPRPHRAPMHPRTVCDEIERATGAYFDPYVARLLLGMVRPMLDSDD